MLCLNRMGMLLTFREQGGHKRTLIETFVCFSFLPQNIVT